MDTTARQVITELKSDPNLSADFRVALGYERSGPETGKPAPGPVELGEWREWKLTWGNRVSTPPDTVMITHSDGFPRLYWKPGLKCTGATPEEVNALLTAYRRAVARGLAEWPE